MEGEFEYIAQSSSNMIVIHELPENVLPVREEI